MGRMIGRDMLATETVHHMDGDRSNNDPSNLELWDRRQPPGQRVRDKIRWALELIKQYPELLSDAGYRLLALESAESSEVLGKPSFTDFDAAEVIRRFASLIE